jgi:threonylcarbamoyladenosine tRNA methylthiotransferase MtaB
MPASPPTASEEALCVTYHTFGCKANQYDTERMRQELEARGARTVPGPADADVVVVNTCTVTNRADAEARRFIRRVRREHPHVEVVAAGCSAALQPTRYASMPGVGAVVQGSDPQRVASAATRLRGPLVQISEREENPRDASSVGADVLLRRRDGARGWLKVQDGCDRKCSFCATRLARGPSRSRSSGDVVREALMLSKIHPELVITGIHIGHYGQDLEPKSSLSRLVARLLDEVPDVRFRLGSIEATELDDALVHLIEVSGGRLAPHLHMPLQSGADPVLRSMRRWHTRDAYRHRTLEIASRLPVLGLGADIIVGFPGERASDHRATVSLVEELPFTYLHVFPFSPRDGTDGAARHRTSPVPQRVARERSRELRALASEKGTTYRRSRDGECATVVLEGRGGTALTGDYLRVGVGLPPGPPTIGPSTGGLRSGHLRWSNEDLTIDLTRTAQFN